ncbi:MAG: hypothetical protein ACHQIH_02710 [Ignavibacteria bacterium]
MTFKKDYINYLLYSVVNSKGSELRENYRLSKLVDSIMANDDVMKVTYLIGKTAGLELLFKYLLYISDKIDKSHVSIFNLKDNFEYDKKNLLKICEKINDYKSENVQDVINNISSKESVKETAVPEDSAEPEAMIENQEIVTERQSEDEDKSNLLSVDDSDRQDETDENTGGSSKLTLIENEDSNDGESEIFELDSISESVENSGMEKKAEPADEDEETSTEEFSANEVDSDADVSVSSTDINEEGVPEDNISIEEELVQEPEGDTERPAEVFEDLPEIEIIVHKPMGQSSSSEEGHVKEESITNEAYYKFETKFFEEVKILEKLFATVDKDCRISGTGKLSGKCLQSLTEIIGITSELSNLSRQLSFDLIADIFLTMNIYFTKSISQPEIFTSERIKLLDSSLALVNSLIKGEDYLNYDTVVDKIEKLKFDISQGPESRSVDEAGFGEEFESTDKEVISGGESYIERVEKYSRNESSAGYESADISGEPPPQQKTEEAYMEEELRPLEQKSAVIQSQIDSANFKLKFLIKEFEKIFAGINDLKGEYSKFDALEKISELNNALRLIAKISAEIKFKDVLKLAEVTYVFLKYVKDYRMDLTEPEIQQIVKYIIFTFKMLITNRKPEDFNVLVQHLNNPVKIFADS